MPRAVRERVLARARVARLPGLAADKVQDEDVLDAERLPELLLAALQDVVGVRERHYKDDGATLADLREAVTTLEDVDRIARRVFGGAHPDVENVEASLENARAALRARGGNG